MTTPPEIILVRHGDTKWTERGLLHGHRDIPLSEQGIRQARLAAHSLSSIPLKAIISSPLQRAMQTATIIAEPHGLTPKAEEGFRERFYGWAEGISMSFVNPSGNQLLRPLADMLMERTGEQRKRFVARVTTAADKLLGTLPNGHVVVVAHWGVLCILASYLVEGTTENADTYGPWAAGGITRFRQNHKKWELLK